MSEYTKHHFVPQFCLREFAIDPDRKRLGTYLIQRRQYIASTSIRAQAQRAKLYGSEERERILSQIESAAALVLRRATNELEVPKRHSAEHATLLVHVLFQSSRTPTAAAEFEEGANQLAKMMMSHDERVAPYLDRVQLKIQDGAVHTLSMAGSAIPLTTDLHYKLLHNQTDVPYIISDHPVGKYNQFMERRRIDMGCTGYASRGLQTFLPISPRVTLMMYDGDVYRVGRGDGNSVVEANEADVQALNQLQIVNASSQLFFNTQMTEGMIQHLVGRSQPWIGKPRSSIREFPQPPKEPGTHRSIVITSLKDIRIGLKLSSVVELPSAQKYRVTNGTSLVRDPRLCELHYDFQERVSAGLYSPGDFATYLDDVAARKVRCFFERI